ncbi:MAG: methyltransferase domain-containing protein [Bdellovibrionales bacterium]|nr:methyltransferase domain-containing protein [Bdellovibrionales bacterium]
MSGDIHHDSIRQQFAQRIPTYERAATWMLSRDLIAAQREAAGPAPAGRDLCLDLCCGTGVVGRNLLDLGWKMRGLDLTPEMGYVASQYFPVRIGSVESIDSEPGVYDLATLRQSFMLVDGDKALSEIHRILKPGGRFILIQSVSFGAADDEVYSQVQWARHINQKTYYRQIDLENALRNHGFSIVGAKTLRIRESVDHWLNSAPELQPELRQHIRKLIADAPDAYKWARDVRETGGELFEDWNWLILTGQKD